MSSTGVEACSDCVYSAYPARYSQSRRYAALVVAALDLFILYGGLLFVWLRRNQPLISRRDWSLSIGLALTNVLWLIVPYREFFNEDHLPCPAYYFVSTFNTSVMPALVAVRWIGLYARHVRQSQVAARPAVQVTVSGECVHGRDVSMPSAASAAGEPLECSHTQLACTDAQLDRTVDVAGTSDAAFTCPGPNNCTRTQLEATGTDDTGSAANDARLPSASSSSPVDVSTVLQPVCAWADRLVMRHRMDAVWPQLALVAFLSLPHFIFYIFRLANPADFPDYSDPKRVGCMFDDTEDGLFVLAPLLLLAVVIPVLLRLRHAHDALGLRNELIVQLIALPPCFIFWIVGEFLEFETTLQFNQEYGITVWLDVISITSMWVPALLSFHTASQNAPVSPVGCGDNSTRRWQSRHIASVAPVSDQLGALCSVADASKETQRHSEYDSPCVDGSAWYPDDSQADFAPGSGGTGGGSAHQRSGNTNAVQVAPAAVGAHQPNNATGAAGGAWAGKLVTRISRHAVVSPAPAADELQTVLARSPSSILGDGRALGVVAAVLMFAPVGTSAIRRILKREFCLETASFVADAFSVRVVCAQAEARLSGSRQGRLQATARSDTAVVAVEPDSEVAGIMLFRRTHWQKRVTNLPHDAVHASLPEVPVVSTTGTVKGVTSAPQTMPFSAEPTSSGTSTSTTGTVVLAELPRMCPSPPRASVITVRPREESSAELPLELPRLRLRALLRHYVSPNADLLVNLSARQTSALESAASALDVAAAAGAPSTDDAVGVLRSAQAALQAAELEIFNLIKRGPVFRYIQTAEYPRWAAAALASLS